MQGFCITDHSILQSSAFTLIKEEFKTAIQEGKCTFVICNVGLYIA